MPVADENYQAESDDIELISELRRLKKAKLLSKKQKKRYRFYESDLGTSSSDSESEEEVVVVSKQEIIFIPRKYLSVMPGFKTREMMIKREKK
jgi:hypothetical protein